ncbi:MAG: GNAT family N-acetyltransferase [Armatimonadetes bacterium]|nr:GNAT family N-acetyltransferase [Armatimonadota bacterium]
MDEVVPLKECVVRIRALEESDLLRLEWEGGEDYRRYYRDEWRCHQAGTQPVLVAAFLGFPIGHVGINLEDDPPAIVSLRVMEPFRDQGIGTALMRASERLCREQGFTTVSIGVNPANAAARRLYERLGYEAIGDPYESEWFLIDRRGRRRRMGETVQTMMRRLDGPAAE